MTRPRIMPATILAAVAALFVALDGAAYARSVS
jgi:hypothetical protein